MGIICSGYLLFRELKFRVDDTSDATSDSNLQDLIHTDEIFETSDNFL